ncbi:hypothetical protein WN944_001960 [Citrus x changshan-huyou]|uniref:Uncharacterized protein n=1 Tax=Citrus x changshan-huyou TaxID=2935761 RepID=A0AAP0QVC0_9ROSI
MSSLKFLNHLNLSNNNLTGKIPSSTQLQSFDASSFSGNDLCGAPLPGNCSEHVSIPKDENGNKDELDYWLYVSIALGFIGGFWCLIGPLLASRRWRYKYCNFLDRLGDRIVFVDFNMEEIITKIKFKSCDTSQVGDTEVQSPIAGSDLIWAPRSRSATTTPVRSRSVTTTLVRSRTVTNDLLGYDSGSICT